LKRIAAGLIAITSMAACTPPRLPTAAPSGMAGSVKPIPATVAVPADPADAKMERMLLGGASTGPVIYTIYPGDQLRVAVLGHQDLSFSFRVPTEGFMTYPLIGKIQIVGRSLGDVEREIRERLEKDYLVNPQVSLLIEAYSKKYIYVFGGVKESKAYELPEGQPLTLTQVISMAGGFSADAAKDHVRVIRRAPRAAPPSPAGGQPDAAPSIVEVDVTRITEEGNLSLEVAVGPGDVVVVPSLRKIYVLGQVKAPGGFPITSDQRVTVTQAISLAGGFTSIASERYVRILRRPPGSGTQHAIEVDVWSVIQHGQLERDVELIPGDIVFVPESLF
jgi:polysaccharide export outer membrane protein